MFLSVAATTIKWIRAKLRELGMLAPTNSYRVAFALDSSAMVSVRQSGSAAASERKCKPLGVLWSRFSQYSPRNTIAIDDIRDNFAMNPRSGLRVCSTSLLLGYFGFKISSTYRHKFIRYLSYKTLRHFGLLLVSYLECCFC